MLRHAITASAILLAWAAATQAEILRLETGPRDLSRNTIGNYRPPLPFYLRMEIWQDSVTLEVDTDTQMARVLGATWHTSGVDRTITSRVDYSETIPQPFPDPPIIRTHSIDVTTSYNWPAMNGSFLTGDWAPIEPACCGQWYINAPLDDGGQPAFSLTGSYTLQGETESFTSDFSYSVASRPTETRMVLHSPRFFHADAAYYHLVPDQRVVFDGTIDGQSFRFTLPDIWLPVMLPEPSGLFLAGLAVVGLLRRR